MRRQAFDVLVVGPVVRDHLFVTKAEAPAYGQVIDVKEVPVTLAGSGANVAVALARLGLKVGLVTAVGRDPRGEDVLRELSKEGIDTGLVARVSLAETGLSVTVLRGGSERPPLVFRSLGASSLIETTEEVQKMLHTTTWLYLAEFSGMWASLVGSLLEALLNEPTNLAWHPGAAFSPSEAKELQGQLLARSRLLFVNEQEAVALSASGTTHGDLERALVGRGAGTVVLTLGKEGAHVRAENLHVSASPPSTAVLDTQGAGDAFRAGFLAGFLHSEDPAVALQWGLTNAASVVGSHTTQKGLLAQSVLEERLRKHPIAVDRSMVEA